MTDLQAILDKGGPWQQARIIGDQLLINGDCLEVMAVLPKVDACLTDPPYGIGAGKKTYFSKPKPNHKWKNPRLGNYKYGDWDSDIPHEAINFAIGLSETSIVWGGNYFNLTPAPFCLVWDKKVSMPSFSDGEFAWTNIDRSSLRFFRYLWGGYAKQEPEHRSHPTQKPVALMEWCLGFLPDARTILDPFAGSGTTAVACQRLGRQSISIELDADYWAIMCRRVQEVVDNPPLFIPEVKKPVQQGFEV